MAKILSPERIGAALKEVLSEFDHLTTAKVDRALRAATIQTWTDILRTHPVDTGAARGSWLIGSSVGADIGEKNKRKGASYVKSNVPKKLLGTTLYMYSNLPYISALEFGLYPKSPRKGTKDRKTKAFEIRSQNGFSKLAPKGMVRINVIKWPKTLRNILKGMK